MPAIGGAALTGAQAVRLYGRRFTIEETFRDVKDARLGLGMSMTHIGDPRRRDRLLLICAMAMTLLTLLGQAGESLGMDRMLKANTVKKRTHSLFRQGCAYYTALPMMPAVRAVPLLQRFGELILNEPVYVQAFDLAPQNEGMFQLRAAGQVAQGPQFPDDGEISDIDRIVLARLPAAALRRACAAEAGPDHIRNESCERSHTEPYLFVDACLN